MCDEVHRVPDDEAIQEEDATETQTYESSSDVAECVCDGGSTAAAAEPTVAEQTPVPIARNSEQDNT